MSGLKHLVTIKRQDVEHPKGGIPVVYDAGSELGPALFQLQNLLMGYESRGFAVFECDAPYMWELYKRDHLCAPVVVNVWLTAVAQEMVN